MNKPARSNPYKNGKPNPSYFNPSFVSSHLFYPKQYLQPQQQQVVVTKNYIPNANDIKKDALYRQRLRTQNISRSKTKEKEQKRNREFNKQRQSNIGRICRINQPQTLLKNELGNLHNYRQNFQQKQDRFKDLSRRLPQPQLPVYLQKPRKKGISEYRVSEQSNTGQLSDYSAVTKEFKELKRQLKRNNVEQENRAMDMIIMQNRQLQRQEQYQHRKQSQLLGNILREQIKTNELRKEKRWNY